MVTIRQCRDGTSGTIEIEEGSRGQVILKWQIACAGAPSKRLDGDAEVLLEADWIRDVPAVEAEALLRDEKAIGADDLRQSRVWGCEFLILASLPILEAVGATEVVLGAGAAYMTLFAWKSP